MAGQETDGQRQIELQLGAVQKELLKNNSDIAALEEALEKDAANALLLRKYDRLVKKEQLLLEERKIWAGACYQNNSWQAGLHHASAFKELLVRVANACGEGKGLEGVFAESGRGRGRPKGTGKAEKNLDILRSETPGKAQLLMLADAADATESSGQGGGKERGPNPLQPLNPRPEKGARPWVRDRGKRRDAFDLLASQEQGRRRKRLRFLTEADGLGFDVPLSVDDDPGLAAYVGQKLAAEDEPAEVDRSQDRPADSQTTKPESARISQRLKVKQQSRGEDVSYRPALSQQSLEESGQPVRSTPRYHGSEGPEFASSRNPALDSLMETENEGDLSHTEPDLPAMYKGNKPQSSGGSGPSRFFNQQAVQRAENPIALQSH